MSVDKSGEDDDDTKCGIGKFRPSFLQRYTNMPMFTFINSGATLITSTLTAYIASQIPFLEKQFGLSSYESGILMSANDIGFLIFCLFVTSIAKFVHIPRFLFYCGICFGISGILCALPHFLTPRDQYMSDYVLDESVSKNISQSTSRIQLCLLEAANGTNKSSGDDCNGDMNSHVTGGISSDIRKMALGVIALGMFFQGVGKAPRTSFLTVYVDDNTDKRKTGFYIGIMSAASIVGSALAFGMGAVFSTIYVTTEDVDMNMKDPRWIGAWWIGFLLFGLTSIVIVLPLICFPRRLKWRKKDQEKGRQPPKLDNLPVTNAERVKDRLKSYYRVLCIPLYISILFTNCFQVLSMTGYISFLSKYIATQWRVSVMKANFILGVSELVALAVGAFLGGVVTRKVRMTPRNAFGWLFGLFCFQNALFSFGFILGCDQPDFVGPLSVHNEHTITNNCSYSCECATEDFFPVCGSDNINYHSPCFAGCTNIERGGRLFSNCTCIPDGMATAGLCSSAGCNTLYAWAVTNFASNIIGSMKMMVSFIAKIRCVKEKDKSTAMGLQTFLLSLVAFMPAPIIYGKIIDTTCLIWQSSCSNKGSCLFYDTLDFRIKLHAYTFLFKVLAHCSTAFALWYTWRWRNWKQIQTLEVADENDKVKHDENGQDKSMLN